MGKMISISEVSKLPDVTVKTLKIWDNECYQKQNTKRLVDIDDMIQMMLKNI